MGGRIFVPLPNTFTVRSKTKTRTTKRSNDEPKLFAPRKKPPPDPTKIQEFRNDLKWLWKTVDGFVKMVPWKITVFLRGTFWTGFLMTTVDAVFYLLERLGRRNRPERRAFWRNF